MRIRHLSSDMCCISAEDLIPLAAGQKRLLKAEIFKRFEELVDNLEYKQSEKDTTCADLHGFWDMASFQIQDLRHKFNSLTILEECGWEKACSTSKDVFQDKFVSGIASEPKQDGAGIPDGGRLAAVKKAVRERMQPGERAEAVGSAVPKEVDHIMFDAGSFRIESPVKSFSVFDNKNLMTECHLLDSPRPGCSDPFTQVEK
ncbi:disks large-associated protein 5-like isoform X2 [Equus caballus]|uniref:disks large-associated protein 5-like isoform X2 n=1 Tax=Equus caballus TaxID=9796 RepID=UPI0038B33CCF